MGSLARRTCAVAATVSLFLLTVTLFLVFSTHGDDPTEYRLGDTFYVSMGPLISPKSVVVWPYYWYRFPRGAGFRTARQAFWDALLSLYTHGDSGFRHVEWREPPVCRSQTTTTNETEMFYTTTELGRFAGAIRDGFRVNLYVDGVRVVSPAGDGWWWGFDIGETIGSHVLLYNHVDLHVDLDRAGRVIKVVADPRHTDSTALCGPPSDMPNHPVDPVRWSYRTYVRTTDARRRDMTKIYDDLLSPRETKLGYAMFAITAAAAAAVIAALGALVFRISRQNKFTLDDIAVFLEPAARDVLISLGSSSDDDVDERRFGSNTKYALARMRGAIMGRPRAARTLATIVASSLQFVVVVFTALLVSIAYQHAWNNMFQVVVVFLLPTTGAVTGFFYQRLMQQWQLTTGRLRHVAVSLQLTLPLYGVFFATTSMQMLYHDAAIIAALFFTLAGLALLNAVMYGTGVLLALAFSPAAPPDIGLLLPAPGTSVCERITRYGLSCVVIAAIQGCGAVYIAVLILGTPWTTHVKQQFWFTWLFGVLWLLSGAFASVISAYWNVTTNRYPHWQWPTFATGLCVVPIVWFVALVYTYDKTAFVDASNRAAVFVYLTVASVIVGVVSGGVNWYATHVFFKYIYGQIVVKD